MAKGGGSDDDDDDNDDESANSFQLYNKKAEKYVFR